MKNFLRVLLFVVGLIICSYPIISCINQSEFQKNMIQTYENDVSIKSDVELAEMTEMAKEYNDVLYQSKGFLISNEQGELLSENSYYKLMNIDSNGIMGRIEIPKINVNLPIFHGTDTEILSIGIGHLFGSSLPVGGINTRSVLTGHRGLPNSKLFTRLDEMKLGDMFYIYSYQDVLAYKIVDIDVIKPERVESLNIVPEKDLVTLVTCTPYGINTHRLLVTGERVEYKTATYDAIKPEAPSIRELFFFAVPFIFAGSGLIKIIHIFKKRR